MKKRLAVTLLLAFGAASAYADHPSGGHSRGGHSGGGYGRGGATAGGHAYPRGRAPGPGVSSAVARHPRAGSGGGYYYGHRYGYGSGYGYARYPYHSRYGRYPYYSYYPSYAYYPYYGYGYPYWGGYGLGIGLYYSGGYYGSGYYGSGYYGRYSAPYYYYEDEYSSAPYSRRDDPDEEYAERGEPREASRAETGELRLVVRPDDAVVYVDDEFRGVAGRLVSVRLSPGRHRVEVVRPGFEVAVRDIDVGRGATASLQIELERH